jgi:hypothetical protein
MKQLRQVVMLPTNDDTTGTIIRHKANHSILNTIKNPPTHHEGGVQAQHIYITSNEEIKEGDWFIRLDSEIVQCELHHIKHMEKESELSWRKVIATTDTNLGYKERFNGVYVEEEDTLAFIPESFIKAFVESNGTIKEVLVEYVGDYDELHKGWLADTIKLKTRPDNTIVISATKDSYRELYEKALERLGKMMLETYTRDEVERLCKAAYNKGHYNGITSSSSNPVLSNKWIEDHL